MRQMEKNVKKIVHKISETSINKDFIWKIVFEIESMSLTLT